MNRVLLLFSILINLSVSNTFGQKSLSTLYFKDGTQKEGQAKFKSFGKLKFRSNKNEKYTTYHWRDIEKVIKSTDGYGDNIFYY